MHGRRGLRAAWSIAAALAIGAVVLAACGGGSSTGTTVPKSVNTTVPKNIQKGGTVVWAMQPATKPNWIFPFSPATYFSVSNLTQFAMLMYRPLYWFGPPTSAAPSVDYPLSLANPPVWSNDDKTVTVSLKGWHFKDGQVVDAQSVIFWMNMMKAVGAADWAAYASGPEQYPGNIASYSAASASALSVTFNLTGSFNPTWYLYNELSQITPMAEAWDVTSLTAKPGSGGCGAVAAGPITGAATAKACAAVWTFDTDNGGTAAHAHMAGDVDTYGTNPLWAEGVDGPWYLSSFDGASSEATFLPNATYNGPQKPIISKFIEVPYASADSEFDALAAGGPNAPQVGYLPSTNTPQKPAGLSLADAGPNAPQLMAGYNLSVQPLWSVNFSAENFDSTLGAAGHAGAVFKQLYFRQALQDLVDQPGMIQTYYKGYGVPTYGPAPVYPPNPFASGLEVEPDGPYPFSQTAAMNLLKDNGWDVKAGGTSTCVKPGTAKGDCGAGIPAGTPASFLEWYESGIPALEDVVQYEVSEWAKVGIQVATKGSSFNGVLGIAIPCTPGVSLKACQGWDIANWGAGWVYGPDYLPTGEEIFATGAISNTGNYSNPTDDNLIVQTNRSSSSAVFTTWENFLAEQLPVIWQPNTVQEPEIAKNLGGVLPLNSLDNLTPEYWYYTSTSPS
jgi:peptide/nickel transport system substrate-binding protein